MSREADPFLKKLLRAEIEQPVDILEGLVILTIGIGHVATVVDRCEVEEACDFCVGWSCLLQGLQVVEVAMVHGEDQVECLEVGQTHLPCLLV